MSDYNEQHAGEVEHLLDQVKGTPAYFGFRLNNYWERIIAFIDQNGLSDTVFGKELAELDELNNLLPLPVTQLECERRENRMREISRKFAEAKGLNLESFWADFDPETGLQNKETLQYLIGKNRMTRS